jgi:hypothetical protein
VSAERPGLLRDTEERRRQYMVDEAIDTFKDWCTADDPDRICFEHGNYGFLDWIYEWEHLHVLQNDGDWNDYAWFVRHAMGRALRELAGTDLSCPGDVDRMWANDLDVIFDTARRCVHEEHPDVVEAALQRLSDDERKSYLMEVQTAGDLDG